jgi:hypothetical protein
MLMICQANAKSLHVITDNLYSTDSDNTLVQLYTIGGGIDFTLNGNNTRLELTQGSYKVSDYSYGEYTERSFDVTKLYGETRLSNAVDINGSYWVIGEFNVGNLTGVYSPNTTWRTEISYAKSMVDTTIAIDGNIQVDTYSASVDYVFNPKWTLVGSYAFQSFTDDNTKNIALSKLVYSSSVISGLTYQLYYRYADTEFNPIEYFGPQKQQRVMLGTTYGKAFLDDRIAFRGQFFYGRQMDEFSSTNAIEVKMQLRGAITDDLLFKCEYIYSNDRGNINSGIDYKYQMAMLRMEYHF